MWQSQAPGQGERSMLMEGVSSWVTAAAARAAASLFDVLHLLAQLLDGDLHVDRDRRHLDRRRLRAERVGLAQQLLDDEFEALADLCLLYTSPSPRDGL